MSPECLKDARIELVTVNGRPFTLMENAGFRKIIEPLQNAMGNNFVINSSNIRDMVSSVAQEGREELKNDLKGRLLMLKIDSATCRDRSVLGVNVQYTDGEKTVLRTLAVRELNDRHTAEYISSVVQDVLHEYDVELRQVYSITSDNGANMIKAVSLLSDIQEDTMCNEVNEADTMDKEEDGDETDIQDESQELVPDLAIELDSVMQ
ncbi:Zinc finger BED domain-containing [Labeo rohita]|uniref:Zinc finger BED domain-containing n=1 Tax=Labeo rohita TaxID=84645 RepID=A0A498NFB8_LABRO|nr:Zinc finger BED domain-containing [Labeo rohita]